MVHWLAICGAGYAHGSGCSDASAGLRGDSLGLLAGKAGFFRSTTWSLPPVILSLFSIFPSDGLRASAVALMFWEQGNNYFLPWVGVVNSLLCFLGLGRLIDLD